MGSIFPSHFIQEGYFDCELALRFGYPMKKRNKLLKRKFFLAWRDKKKLLDTLREMEEMIKRRLFTEEQLKCKYKSDYDFEQNECVIFVVVVISFCVYEQCHYFERNMQI